MRRNWILSGRCFLFAFAFTCSETPTASAADPASAAIQKVLTGLKGPRSVAVRPDGAGEQCEVFVAEGGVGRIVRFTSSQPGKSADAIAGFAIQPSTDQSVDPPGIRSLLFLDHSRLAVMGANDDKKPFFRFYELPESDAPLTADQHKGEVSLPVGEKESRADLRSLPGIARSQPNEKVGDALLLPSWTDHGAGGLIIIPVTAGILAEPIPVRLKSSNSDLEIGGIAVSKSGYVIIARSFANQSGHMNVLEFVNPIDRRVVMHAPIELGHITALAYNPKSGNLYAANFPKGDEGHAGIYRIDDVGKPGAPACAAVKIADVQRPTALTFAPDGLLYVTSLGDSTDASSDDGVLLKLVGVL